MNSNYSSKANPSFVILSITAKMTIKWQINYLDFIIEVTVVGYFKSLFELIAVSSNSKIFEKSKY